MNELKVPVIHGAMKVIPSAVIGVVAAVVTVFALEGWRAREVKSEPVRAVVQPLEGEKTVIKRVIGREGLDRLAELERRVKELQSEKARSEDGPAMAGDAEATRKRVDERFAELDRLHEQDAPDPTWSMKASEQFAGDLAKLGEKLGFSIGPTECKTTTCRAAIQYESYSAARTTMAQLVEHSYNGLNCEQGMRLAEPEHPDSAYTAHLYLDCKDLRAGLADEIVRSDAE
jgi:hypothetical protein